MMDVYGVKIGIGTILQVTNDIIKYLNELKDGPRNRAQCAVEASNLYNLLVNLNYRVEEGSSSKAWFTGIRALAVEGGPFDQYSDALRHMLSITTTKSGIGKIKDAFGWKFTKEEVNDILSRIDRLKVLVQVALEMDHLSVLFYL
jgi:hypothetical protein